MLKMKSRFSHPNKFHMEFWSDKRILKFQVTCSLLASAPAICRWCGWASDSAGLAASWIRNSNDFQCAGNNLEEDYFLRSILQQFNSEFFEWLQIPFE